MGLRDYPSDAWNRSAPSVGTPNGPLVSPIKGPTCDVPVSPQQAAKDVHCIKGDMSDLAVMVSMLVDVLTVNNPPKGSIPIRQYGQASIAAVAQGAAASLISSYSVIEGYAGYIQRIQLITDPEPASPDIQYSLRINNKTIPNFDQYTNAQNNAFELNVFVPATSTIQVYAKNIGTGSILAAATIIGWISPVRRY